jgi:6-phospho-beta-glucosidase
LEYYYFPAQKLQKLLNTPKTRGEVCIELEEELLDLYSQQELHEKPVQLSKRGGARYSEVAINLINAIYNNLQEVHVVNVLNNGALDFLADDDVIEISAIIGKDGAKPIKANVANQHVIEYIQMIKAYERHVVNAALSGDKLEAMRGALMNPLTSDLKNFSTCFDEMVQAHKKYLPQFKE